MADSLVYPEYENIKSSLLEIEKEHEIRLLFACESGSRAWGFPSPDSDYDVRFIYAHTVDWYLSIQEGRDVVEIPINKELDINGWEIRKTLRLMRKHNAAILEWIQSPIMYIADEVFLNDFKQMAKQNFSAIASLHHYLSTAKKYDEECTSTETTKLKKYLYCIRCTLAAKWVAHYRTMPPMELGQLVSLLKNEEKDLLDKILELVRLKATQNESYVHPRDLELDAFLKDSLAYCESIAPSLPSATWNEKTMDLFFKNTVQHHPKQNK